MRGEKRYSNLELYTYEGRGGKGMGSRASGPGGGAERRRQAYTCLTGEGTNNKLVVTPEFGKTRSEK